MFDVVMNLFTQTNDLGVNITYDASIIKEYLNQIYSLVKMFSVQDVFQNTKDNPIYDAVARGAHRCLEPLMKIAKEYPASTNYDRFIGQNVYENRENFSLLYQAIDCSNCTKEFVKELEIFN